MAACLPNAEQRKSILRFALRRQSKELQPRQGETDRKAGSGLRQVDNHGDADGAVHMMLQNGSFDACMSVAARFLHGDLIS
jgi:hypothetical protein